MPGIYNHACNWACCPECEGPIETFKRNVAQIDNHLRCIDSSCGWVQPLPKWQPEAAPPVFRPEPLPLFWRVVWAAVGLAVLSPPSLWLYLWWVRWWSHG
jgi:hypothetical protein